MDVRRSVVVEVSQSGSNVDLKQNMMKLLVFFALWTAAVVGHDSPACKAPLLRLNDGHLMPRVGFGTWLGFTANVNVTDRSVARAVEVAIDEGYRHIDTADIYDIEDQVGEAVNNKIEGGVVKRKDVFITTKLWNDQHSLGAVVPALRRSLARANLTYVDLFLVHWPIATQTRGIKPYADIDYLETWQGMLAARSQGLASSIGVSNFNLDQLKRLINESGVKPAVLQVETNLNLQQPELRRFCHEHGIAVVGYTPFGSLFTGKAAPDAPPPRVDDPTLQAIAGKYKKTVPQLVLRYLFELGVTPIPKSVTPSRIRENFDILDFQLDEFDREQMRTYHTDYRVIDVKFWSDSPYYPFNN